MTTDAKSVLSTLVAAKEEILSLRRAYEIAQAKVDTMEIFRAAIGGPRPSGGAMHPDPVWTISEQIRELQEEIWKAEHPRTEDRE